MIALAVVVDEWPSNGARLAVLALFGVSSFVEGVGALTTGFGVQGGPFTFELVTLNLPWLLQGKLDAWWISFWSLQSSAAVVLLPMIVLIALWSVTTYAMLGKQGFYRQRWLGSLGPWHQTQRKTKTTARAAADSKT
jgi:hypothetical protein